MTTSPERIPTPGEVLAIKFSCVGRPNEDIAGLTGDTLSHAGEVMDISPKAASDWASRLIAAGDRSSVLTVLAVFGSMTSHDGLTIGPGILAPEASVLHAV